MMLHIGSGGGTIYAMHHGEKSKRFSIGGFYKFPP